MATVKYSTRVKEYIQALTGIDDLTSQEEGFIKSAFNRRVRMAYEESRLWPRYLKEELRRASFDNTIPNQSTGDTEIDTFIDIYSANPRNQTGSSQRYDWITRGDGAKILGLDDSSYQSSVYKFTKDTIASGEIEDISTKARKGYAISFWLRTKTIPVAYGAGSESTTLLAVNGDGTGALSAGDSVGGFYVAIDSTGTCTFSNTWDVAEGTSMDVYGDGLYSGVDYGSGDAGVEIQNAFDGDWHHFIWTFPSASALFQNLGSVKYEVGGDSNQTHDLEIDIADIRIYGQKIDATQAWNIYSNPASALYNPVWTSSVPEYWVSYKAALTATYGDGASEVDDVPLEFFLYGVHGAYADWLRGEGQSDKAFVEEKFAQEHLQQQLEKIQMTQGSPYIWSRFSTTGSRQNRNYLTRRS